MADLVFHLNVGDRLAYACRLLRKAYLKGARPLVLVDAPALDALDRALWLMGQGDFVPHARAADPAIVRRHSPILIGTQVVDGFAADVLVNVGGGFPEAAERFDRIIEIVGSEPQDRQGARERWKRYKSDGFEPRAHDLAETRDS